MPFLQPCMRTETQLKTGKRDGNEAKSTTKATKNKKKEQKQRKGRFGSKEA